MKFRQFVRQHKLAELGGDWQVVAESHPIVVGANDESERAVLLLQLQPQFLPMIPHFSALAEMIFPNAIMLRRFGPDNDCPRTKLSAVLEFQTESGIRQHGFAIHHHSII